MIVTIAGGVGGAKLAQGIDLAVPAGGQTVVVNTADDFELYGLRICPDLDTVLYTLAGLANPATGWGIAGDSRATLDAVARLGREPWFILGDQDLATHILRTERLRAGVALSEVTAEFASALGVRSRMAPMTDEPVATIVRTPDGELAFQDYFVRRRQEDTVLGVAFRGVEAARPAPGVIEAIEGAEVIVFAPSNPIVSVGPILAVPGVRAAIEGARAPRVAVSPIVGGKAIKGPADRMLATLGHEVSAAGVAAIYNGLIDALVIDEVDRDLAPRIADSGVSVLVTGTVMGGADDRRRLAVEVLEFARSMRPVGAEVG